MSMAFVLTCGRVSFFFFCLLSPPYFLTVSVVVVVDELILVTLFSIQKNNQTPKRIHGTYISNNSSDELGNSLGAHSRVFIAAIGERGKGI